MLVRSDIVDIFLKAINGLPSASGEGLRLPDESPDAWRNIVRQVPAGRKYTLPAGGRLPRAANSGKKALRRIFISDWELKRLHKPAEKSIHVPQGAIISPLSRDWLEYEDIEVIFDETGK